MGDKVMSPNEKGDTELRHMYGGTMRWKPETGQAADDPFEEDKNYVNHKWIQKRLPIQTECFRCHATSPVIYCNPMGSIAFGNPRLLRDAAGRRYTDITKEVQLAFAGHGWKFQLKRSYCPECKGLGSV